MSSRHLLAIALLVFSPAFGQSKQNDTAPSTPQTPSANSKSEPWRILPRDMSKPVSSKDSVNSMQFRPLETTGKDQGIILQDVPNSLAENSLVSQDNQILPEVTCLKIRSYVVARDSKDSDATHLVHYSTCQPSNRYRLRTVEMPAQPPSK